MAITSDNRSTKQTTTVAVRIPNGADGDLETETVRRLTRVAGIEEATVDDLRGLDPGLSATVVTVSVTVETAGKRVESAMADASFVEQTAPDEESRADYS